MPSTSAPSWATNPRVQGAPLLTLASQRCLASFLPFFAAALPRESLCGPPVWPSQGPCCRARRMRVPAGCRDIFVLLLLFLYCPPAVCTDSSLCDLPVLWCTVNIPVDNTPPCMLTLAPHRPAKPCMLSEHFLPPI